jgi:xanthosine utilization system XapX-like protein
LKVRSPAPPVIALIGLLGILLGEQIPPLLQSLLRQPSTVRSWRDQVHPHVFGQLPRGEMREAGEVDHV